MKRIFSYLFAIITLMGTTGVFTSCQEDAPAINYTINVTVNNDFTEVVNAINNGTMKQEAAIAALTAAIEKMQGDQDSKLQAIADAINSLASTLDAKLAIIEAAMKAQTLALETKLDLLEAAIKALPDYTDQLQAIEAAIAALPNYGDQLGAIAAAIEALPDYTDQMAALETALKTIAANIKAQEGQYADELAALTESIDAIKSEVAAGNKSQEEALAEIIALLESGAIAGGGSGGGSGGEGSGEGEGGEGSGGEGEGELYSITFTTSKAIGETMSMSTTDGKLSAVTGADIEESYIYTYTAEYSFRFQSQTVTIKWVEEEMTAVSLSNDQITSLDPSKASNLKRLYCQRNELTQLDVSKNTELITLKCFNNQIKGENMTNLVKSLPDRTEKNSGAIFLKGDDDCDNVALTTDVAIAKAKNWKVLDKDGNEYAGI